MNNLLNKKERLIKDIEAVIGECLDKGISIDNLCIAKTFINDSFNVFKKVDIDYINESVNKSLYVAELKKLKSMENPYCMTIESAKKMNNFEITWGKGGHLEMVSSIVRTINGEQILDVGDTIVMARFGDISCEIGYYDCTEDYREDDEFRNIMLLVEDRDIHGDWVNGDFDEDYVFSAETMMFKDKMESYLFDMLIKNARKRGSKLFHKTTFDETINIV